ncbi:MFS transporter [Streptomyces sp. NPDC005474]|uniref:MFS transporter n=1 Tax=Streptomyces sp. NPDC005474 TaxID=3154878 RepID=UPI0034563DDA
MYEFAPPPVSADGFTVQDTEPIPEGGGGLRLALLMAGSCLPVLGAVLLAPVLPDLQERYRAVPGAAVLVPMILTIPAFTMALIAPLAGVVIDRLGRKHLLVVATALYALFGTAPLWLDSLRAIVASRVLLGAAEACIITCCTTLLGDYYSGRMRDRYLALQTVCATISATVFLILGGVLGDTDWRAPFQLYAVGLLLAPAMAAFVPKPGRNAAEDALLTAGPGPTSVLRPAGTCLLTVFGGIIFYAVPVETAYLMNGLGIQSSGLIGMVTAIASAATITGSVVFASMIGSPERRLSAIFMLCGVGFVVIGLAQNVAVLIIGAFFNCIGTGLLLPTLLTWATSGLKHANRGRGTGMWTASFFLGQFLCPLVVMALASATGGRATAVSTLGLTSAVVALGSLPLLRRRTRAQMETPA